MSDHNFEEAGLVRRGDNFATPGYAESPDRYDITIEAGAADVNLRWQ